MHGRLTLIAIAVLGGCTPDPAELVREAETIRGDCTKEGLTAGDESCVQAAERSVSKLQEVMAIGIGAVRVLDRALDRMPDAPFDTAGLGRAISDPALLEQSLRHADSLRGGRLLGTSRTDHRAPERSPDDRRWQPSASPTPPPVRRHPSNRAPRAERGWERWEEEPRPGGRWRVRPEHDDPAAEGVEGWREWEEREERQLHRPPDAALRGRRRTGDQGLGRYPGAGSRRPPLPRPTDSIGYVPRKH